MQGVSNNVACMRAELGEVKEETGKALGDFKAEVKEDFVRMESNLENLTAEHEETKAGLTALKCEVTRLKSTALQSPVSASSHAGLRPSSESAPSWEPSRVEVKGFVTEEAWKPGNEALKERLSKTKVECITMAKKIVEQLPVDLQRRVDLKTLDRYSAAYLYTRVDLPIVRGAPPGTAKAVLDGVEQVLLKVEFSVDGVSLRACVEKHPNYRQTSRTLGKAFGALRGLGVSNSSMVPAYNPLRIKSIANGRPVSAFIHEAGAWKLDGEGKRELLPEATDEAILNALNNE